MRDKRKDDQKTRVSVNIFGDEYIIKGTASPDHIERIARLVDKKMRELGQKAQYLSPMKIAVLASLNLADELVKLEDDYNTLVKMIEDEKG